MSEIATNTPQEQKTRFAIVEMLLPHYGKETERLLAAATSLQVYIEDAHH